MQVKEEGKLPVMVFIHGGGFVSGTGGEFEPYVLLDHDVVLVVVQYRLSIFVGHQRIVDARMK